jgi:hypothetical protein
LEEDLKKRGGTIDLRLLDYEKWEDVALYSAIIKLTVAHGVPQGDALRLLERFEVMLNRNSIDGSDFGDLLEFDADMLKAVKKDSAHWLKEVQDGGYHRFQEEYQKELSIAAEALTGFSHGMLMVQFMETKGKKESLESTKDINDAYIGQANRNMSKGTGGGKVPKGTGGAKSTPESINPPKTYERPSGFRKGVRDSVWDSAKDIKGKVKDPLTGKTMDKNEAWDMGHKPGHEFRKHQQSAQDRNINRKQFLDEYNNPDSYRPELPSSNRSHAGEDVTDNYFGP